MSKEKHSDSTYIEYPLKTGQHKYIDRIWSFKCKTLNNNKTSYSLLPDYTSSLIYFRFKDSAIKNKLVIYGPYSSKCTLNTHREVLLVGFRFLPALLPSALDLRSAEIKDKLINCNKNGILNNYSRLIYKLDSAKTIKSIFKYFDELISELSQLIRYPDADIASSIDLMMNSGGNIRESLLVGKLTIGKRQFQRKFLDSNGLTPKEFCRLIRLHLSTRELATGKSDHYDVLVNAGYYDQSHYYREFKKLMGMLPSAFVSRQKNIKYSRLE